MKFQNPSLNFFFERTEGRTNERTSRNQYAPHFFKVGGIMNKGNNYTYTNELAFAMVMLIQ